MADAHDADLIELLNSLDAHNQNEHEYTNQGKQSKIYVDNQGKLKDPFLEGVQYQISEPRHSFSSMSNKPTKAVHTKSSPLYSQPTTSSQLNASLRKSAELRIPIEANDGDDLNEHGHEPFHSETRVKSLSLRLTGQMRTIRALESQLVRDTSQMAEKDKMIRNMQNRIRFLETKNVITKPHYAPPIQQNEAKTKILSKINDKISNQYETQVRTLESRLSEEQSRRLKAEERSRTFKEYLDKLKISHGEYESRNLSLEKVVADLQNKLARQRKEHRDLVNELESRQMDAHSHGAQLETQRRQLAQTDASLRSALQEIDSLREELRFYKTDAAASKSSLQSALSENDSLRARLKSQSAAVSDTDRKVSRVHAFEPTVRHSEPISQPIAYSQSHTAAPDIGIRSSQQRTTNYYSDAPPLHPATRQQISSRTAGQRLSSMSDSEAFVRKSTQNRRHQPVRAYPYDDFTLRKQPASTDRNDLPRRDTFVDKVRARSSSYRYNEAMSIGSDVDTVSSSAYGYDERAAVLNTRPIERSRRHDNSNISVSSAGNTSLKYDRLKSMYKRVTGKDMSRLEYAHQYPGSDDD